MSLKYACRSNCRDYKIHSKKWCCCGGHNATNHKKNLNHNSTKQKESHKTNRRYKWYRFYK